MRIASIVDLLRARAARVYKLPVTPGRISSMEGVRGLAVELVLVFFVHYHQLLSACLSEGTWQFQLSYFLGQIGHTGVDLFFLLSGYLIYGAAIRPSLDIGKFWRRRVLVGDNYLGRSTTTILAG